MPFEWLFYIPKMNILRIDVYGHKELRFCLFSFVGNADALLFVTQSKL